MACKLYVGYVRWCEFSKRPNQPNPFNAPPCEGIKYGFHSGLNELWSFAYWKKPVPPRWLEPTDSCFLDSGAFTASTKGKVIDIGEYAEYVKEIIPKLAPRKVIVANLDDISDPQKSLENWHELRRRGVETMPVYHAGEPERYLDAYAAETDYVGYGGVAKDGSSRALHDALTKFQRHPGLKWHGFGITRKSFLLSLPWYSVDSASLMRKAAYHLILTPFSTLCISNKTTIGEHINRGTPLWHKLEEWVDGYGRDLELACGDTNLSICERYLISYDALTELIRKVPTEIPDSISTANLL